MSVLPGDELSRLLSRECEHTIGEAELVSASAGLVLKQDGPRNDSKYAEDGNFYEAFQFSHLLKL